MKEVVEIESIEQEPKLSPEITTDRLPDGQLTRSETLEGDDGVVSVSKDFYCDTRTFDFLVSVSFADANNAPSLVLRPHGGPDRDTDEYTEVGFQYLEPDTEGHAEAAIYDLPEVAVYELVERTEVTDDTTETSDGLIVTISSPPFDSHCEEVIEPEPEVPESEYPAEPADDEADTTEPNTPQVDGKDPEVDIDTPSTDDHERGASQEQDDDNDIVEPNDTIESIDDLFEDAETESQATVVEPQHQDPNAEMPKTGSDIVLMVALGAAAAVTGIIQLRKTRYLSNK